MIYDINMKILYIITQGERGGAQKHLLEMAIYMSGENEVFVAVGAREKAADNWLFESLKQSGFSESRLFTLANLQREINLKKDARAFTAIYKIVKNIKPDIVHLHSTKAGVLGAIAARIADSKVVYTVHGFVFLEPLNFIKKFFYIATEFFASFFRDAIITVSENDFAAGKKYGIIRGGAGTVIYNGIDESIAKNFEDRERARLFIFDKIGLSAEMGVRESQVFIVGAIANFYRTKGIEYLISAADLVKKKTDTRIFFVVIGEGELRKEFEQKISELGLLDIFFLVGEISDAYRYLRAFDLFVLPSVKEGLPYVVLEAALAGLPIIASRVGGIAEMSKHIPISLVPAADSEKLSEIIVEEISRARKNDNRFDNNNFSLPQIFTARRMFSDLENVYKRVLKNE